MQRVFLGLSVAVLLSGLAGCVTAPEKIEVSVGGGSRATHVDSERVPATSSHEEARAELKKAYQYARQLEYENARLERKAKKYKAELEECEDRLDKYDD